MTLIFSDRNVISGPGCGRSVNGAVTGMKNNQRRNEGRGMVVRYKKFPWYGRDGVL